VAARDRILDAAESCLRRDGIRRTTMRAVADEAGLSRAYVYRFFSDKPTLLAAALIRRDSAFWADAHERVAAAEDVAGMVAEAVLLSRRAPLGPLALELAEAEPAAYAEVMGNHVHELVPGLLDFWVSHLGEAQARGLVRAELDLEAAAEWVIRVLASLVSVPGRTVDADDPVALRAHLATFLSPALEAQPG
jgi:AcrR family transcriptional regulator